MWFGYDPLGRCVKRWMGPDTGGAVGSNPATYFYYDSESLREQGGWNLLQEGNGTANNVARVYVHGGRVDEMVASQGGGQWRYHHYDARGHCLLLTGPTGSLLEQYEYDAFGFPYFHSATGAKQGPQLYGNRFLFTGREWLGDLRLYDYRNRMYQPELGRFLQPDPRQFQAGDYNLYRYCHNDPVNKTDPTGLETFTRPEMDGEIGDRVVQASQFIGRQIAEMYNEDPVNFIILVATLRAGPKVEGIRAPEGSAPRRLPTEQLRVAWEKLHDKIWPRDPATGRNQDAHHQTPLADQGTNDASNIKPLPHAEHVTHHKDNGDFKRWGGRRTLPPQE
jgi:RHS repeat-associated protein